MNYEKIAEGVIKSAVQKHLRNELRQHCARTAKLKATEWLKKNRRSIDEAIGKAVDARLNKEKEVVVKLAAAGIQIKAPVRRRW